MLAIKVIDRKKLNSLKLDYNPVEQEVATMMSLIGYPNIVQYIDLRKTK